MKKIILLPVVTFVSVSNNKHYKKNTRYEDIEILDQSSELYELLAQNTLREGEFVFSKFNSPISFHLLNKEQKYIDTITINEEDEIADFLSAVDPSLKIGISYPIYASSFLEENTVIDINTNNELKEYVEKCTMKI
ncbi:hypothetical protein SAMN04488096_10896 [Mesonia phycicola]|uniref:Uncharacterized protein n=1 Tax=Mesonia phycicola TaxID=579105 RepID=A0A1M6GL65_9FLAO|nr:hypothetical protein [Mesonia phycicola]SHJ10697.1 hypothetical protein SAMN04488096_10896 [Mesonia phycicola]